MLSLSKKIAYLTFGVLKKKFIYEIKRPKKDKKLPVILNKEEVAKILSASSNAKHKAILMLIYSAGLRVSEVVKLKPEDTASGGLTQIRLLFAYPPGRCAKCSQKGGTCMNNREFNWLLSHPEIEERYVGEYIAIVGDRIVAHGKDFKKVLEEAEKGDREPFIHKVPPLDKELVV